MNTRTERRLTLYRLRYRLCLTTVPQLRTILAFAEGYTKGGKPMSEGVKEELRNLAQDLQDILDQITRIIQDLDSGN